jgi:sec-independent protein translocase protein TatA
MLGSFGVTELLIILFIIIILFGARRLPELARGLGQGINEFKRATRSDTQDEPPAAQKTNAPSSNDPH